MNKPKKKSDSMFLFHVAKCMIPCMNNGKCIGNNKCRCPDGFAGNHCEVNNSNTPWNGHKCKKPCRNGVCQNRQCKCDDGWYGRFCNQRK